MIDRARRLSQKGKDRKALELLRSLDLTKDGEANLLIGQILLSAEPEDSDIKRDARKAVRHLERALELGVSEAGRELASMYTHDDRIKADQVKAEQYLVKAFELNDPFAARDLADLYESQGGPKTREAIRLYTWLIDQGEFVGISYNRLARIYGEGRGVPRQPALMLSNLHKGEEAGDLNCCMQLALVFYRGDGVPMDRERALEFAGRGAAKSGPFQKDAKAMLEWMRTGKPIPKAGAARTCE